jgi:hypothetical protein
LRSGDDYPDFVVPLANSSLDICSLTHAKYPSIPIYVAVVDDDEDVCHSMGRLLRTAGV